MAPNDPLPRSDAAAPSTPRIRPRARPTKPAQEAKKRPHAVIIVENMTVPPDRRVWQQALALKDDGWRVTVISPQAGAYQSPRETISGVDIIRHPLPFEARGLAGYALEYGAALAHETAALMKLGLSDVDVVQICNPPDFLFLPALTAKVFGRAKIIFDHHDLTPELLADKIGERNRFARAMLLPIAQWAEQATFAAADQVISTNGAFRDIAIEKGGKAPADVTVVYSGPDLDRVAPPPADPALKKGADVLLLWVGIMGSQDGLDLLIDAIARLRKLPGGDRFHLLVAGDGPERAASEALTRERGLDDHITFAGFLSGDDLARAFAAADIGVGSDPKNPFNDRLAMNKVMEYMAYRLPIAMFDLAECRKIAGESAFYAAGNDPRALAAALSNLIESPATRAAKGALGRARLEAEYCWERQKGAYLDVYRRLIA